MKKIFENDWQELLQAEMQQEYYQKLRQYLIREYQQGSVYPDMQDIFKALHYTACRDVKVVILGQDPYHGPGQAHGLCFSVRPGVALPPSLVNIYKELHSDLGCSIPDHGDLSSWARQGVLLLNASLTVRAGQAMSHSRIGWHIFTDRIISLVNAQERPIVFILWGNFAASKRDLISNPRHLIIQSAHPSPLSASRGFFGSRPFSQANTFLQSTGQVPIDWQIR